MGVRTWIKLGARKVKLEATAINGAPRLVLQNAAGRTATITGVRNLRKLCLTAQAALESALARKQN